MQLVLDSTDFARLSAAARGELLRLIGGEAQSTPSTAVSRQSFRWRRPHDVGLTLLQKLLKGADSSTRQRMALLARNNGRASMTELLAVTKDKDWHALTPWEGAITRKLRRLIGDENRIASFMQWDYEAEVWDSGHSRLLDGVYFVSDVTTKSLRKYFSLE
jgi:hypothetical protein